MGRYFIIVYSDEEGNSGYPEELMINSSTKPSGRPLERLALGITYSSASGLAYGLLEASGHEFTEKGLIVAKDQEAAAKYPDLSLFARFYTDNDCSWTTDECRRLSEQMLQLLAVVKEEFNEVMLDEYRYINFNYSNDEDEARGRLEQALFERDLRWLNELAHIFREAAYCRATVRTN